jgi:hypothetical protein
MDQDKQSHAQKILSIVRISGTELVIAACVIAILMLIGAVSAYLEELSAVAEVRTLFSLIGENIGDFFNTPLVTNIVTLFFWGLVGLILYSLLWSLFVMFMDISSDIVVSQYFVHPRSFHKSNFWLAALSRRVIVITAYLVIGIYILLLLGSLPIIYNSIRMLFIQGWDGLAATTLSSVLAFGSWLLGWHLVVIVRRLSIRLTNEV